jgi:hypothetical protein
MTIFILYVLAMLINALGVFGAWCTEPEGKLGMILTVLFMFIPGFNWVPAIIYLIITVFQMVEPAPLFKKCTNFWKFLFGEKSIY